MHARHWRKAQMLKLDPGVDRHLHVEDRGFTGPYREAIGRRRTLTIEQRMHHNGSGVWRWLINPKRLELRELFTGGLPCIDRKPASRKAIDFAFGNSPEVACAQKDANLVVVVGPVHRGVEPKAGEAQIGTGLRRKGASKRKKFRLIRNLCRLPGRDLVDINAVRIEEATMEELDLERQLFATPQRMLGAKSNGAVVVVVQIFQGIRPVAVRCLECLAGSIPRRLPSK